MVGPGGIFDITTLKFLLLYVLHFCKRPVTFSILNDIVMRDGLVDFFEFTSALSQMVDSGHVEKTQQGDKEARYTYTPLGEEAIALFQQRLPNHIRQKSIDAAKAVLQEDLTTTRASTELSTAENGDTLLRLSLKEQAGIIFSLECAIPSAGLARQICAQFQQHHQSFFPQLIDLLLQIGAEPQEGEENAPQA